MFADSRKLCNCAPAKPKGVAREGADPEAGAFIFDGLDRLYDLLAEQGGSIVGHPEWHQHDETITDWICSVSPNL